MTFRDSFARTRALLLAVLAAAAFSAPPAAAQTDTTKAIKPGPWKFGATAGLNLSQSAYSSNWAGGDKGSINWVLQNDLTAERQFTRRFHLGNLLQLAYGQTSNQVEDPSDPGRIVFDSPEKTTDLILLESTGRFTIDAWVNPYVGLRAESQFNDQSDPRGDLVLNPVKITESAGIARVFEKTETRELVTRVGFAFRQVFSRGFTDSLGAGTDNFTTNDGGIEWLTTMKRPLMEKKILYKGRLLVFAPVFFTNSDKLEDFDRIALAFDPSREAVADFWRTPSVNFQNTFTASITKHVNVNLYVQWVYQKFEPGTPIDLNKAPADLVAAVDAGIRKAGQFKQTLALGLTYTLF